MGIGNTVTVEKQTKSLRQRLEYADVGPTTIFVFLSLGFGIIAFLIWEAITNTIIYGPPHLGTFDTILVSLGLGCVTIGIYSFVVYMMWKIKTYG